MSSSAQLFNIAGVGHAFAVLGQSVSEDIGHQNNVDFFANGTHGL